ncbi:MAG: NUDIX domain-containing protein, partial [Candidatus Hodarchaeales archaeon]
MISDDNLDNANFVYTKEVWYISALLNTQILDIKTTEGELANFIKKTVSNIKTEDIYLKDYKDTLLDMANNIDLKVQYSEYMENFPFLEENSNESFDSLGYFKIEVEYFKNDHEKKERIQPVFIQQIPSILREKLQKIFSLKKGLIMDLQGPIYVFVMSNKLNPEGRIRWDKGTISRHKKELSQWTVVYSGQWEDYSPELYSRRTEGNLSNRLSELHYIYRNSGFIYMEEENFKKYFERYMVKYVLEPTARMRALIFSLRMINNSLDIMFLHLNSKSITDLDLFEKKIENLRFFRGIIQNTVSRIHNEIDNNRRQHYRAVLIHLSEIFNLEKLEKRTNEKFELLFSTMREIYLKRQEQDQEETEKAINLLGLFLGAEILVVLKELFVSALTLPQNWSQIIDFSLGSIILLMLASILVYFLILVLKHKQTKFRKTVDAVIIDNNNNILLIKRRYPPYRGYYALPGGFIEKGESQKEALKREVEEETKGKIKIIRKIGEYDNLGRDPRGRIHTTAYLCKL